ncbi:histidine phosphatase family protein [Gallaecimonas kandeliae]|uniref:SixA phosphatase family protein n=1 Tax=Gallaecimonas kandeliae TaxID=3029055 RepID=UPI0026499030|nr:histidine phosphatase family protein [Gallaecimonas kandeliae]WKE66822.1 histidine phosphatase family protein [Gallaecimonas kandeliae]
MARILTLIRHAKSSWRHPELDDKLRPLGGRGYRQLAVMAGELAGWPRPEQVLVSDAVRTYSTALGLKVAGAFAKAPLVLEPGLYLAGAEALLACCQAHDSPHLALVAHNPGLEALMARLGLPRPMPTLAAAQLELAGDWQAPGRVKLRHYCLPAELFQ